MLNIKPTTTTTTNNMNVYYFVFCISLPVLSHAYNIEHPKVGKSLVYYDDQPDRSQYMAEASSGVGRRSYGSSDYVTQRGEMVPGYKRKVYVELPEKIEKIYQSERGAREPRYKDDDDDEEVANFGKQEPKVSKVVTFEDGGRQFYDTEEEAAVRSRGYGQPLKASTRSYDLKNMAELSGPLKDYLSSFYESTKSQEEMGLARNGRGSNDYLSSLEPITHTSSSSSYYPPPTTTKHGKRHDDGSEEVVYDGLPMNYENNRNFVHTSSSRGAANRRPTYRDEPKTFKTADEVDDTTETYPARQREVRGRDKYQLPPRDNLMTLSYEQDNRKKYHTTTSLSDFEDEEPAEMPTPRGGARRGTTARKVNIANTMLADEGDEEDGAGGGEGTGEEQADEYGGRPGQRDQGRGRSPTYTDDAAAAANNNNNNNDDDDDEAELEHNSAAGNKMSTVKLSYMNTRPEANDESLHLLGNSAARSRTPPYGLHEELPPNMKEDWRANIENYAREFGFDLPTDMVERPSNGLREYPRSMPVQDYPQPHFNWMAATQRMPTFAEAGGTTQPSASEVKASHLSPSTEDSTATTLGVSSPGTNNNNNNQTVTSNEVKSILKKFDQAMQS